MASLCTEPNIPSSDEFYEQLIGLHRDLTEEESALVNAKLVLLLANHVGDLGVIREALQRAREDVAGG